MFTFQAKAKGISRRSPGYCPFSNVASQRLVLDDGTQHKVDVCRLRYCERRVRVFDAHTTTMKPLNQQTGKNQHSFFARAILCPGGVSIDGCACFPLFCLGPPAILFMASSSVGPAGIDPSEGKEEMRLEGAAAHTLWRVTSFHRRRRRRTRIYPTRSGALNKARCAAIKFACDFLPSCAMSTRGSASSCSPSIPITATLFCRLS